MPDAPPALYRLVVPGEPQPKQRPRVVADGRRTYTPAATVKAEQRLTWHFRQAYPGVQADEVTRFGLRVVFHVRSGRPVDIDNRVKLCLDALNKIVWKDDSQIDELHALVVHRALQPKTVIEIFRSAWR
jgi:Holliday junction resolvase RusA-like endonuclease